MKTIIVNSPNVAKMHAGYFLSNQGMLMFISSINETHAFQTCRIHNSTTIKEVVSNKIPVLCQKVASLGWGNFFTAYWFVNGENAHVFLRSDNEDVNRYIKTVLKV